MDRGDIMDVAQLATAEAECAAYDFGSDFGVSALGSPSAWSPSVDGKSLEREVLLTFGADPYETATCVFAVRFETAGAASGAEARLNGRVVGVRGHALAAA
jgi:hypothetical protein